MERFQAPESIMEELRKRGVSMSQSFDPEEYEQQKCEARNKEPGNLKGYDCPLCLNRGSSDVRRIGHTYAVECSCMEIRRSIRRGKASGLGELLKKCTFDNYQTPESWMQNAKRIAEVYAEDPQGWFVAAGVSGSGKTHLSTAICNRFLATGRAVRYMLWKEEAPKIKAAAMDADVRPKLVNSIIGVDVLYIDDFLKTANKAPPTRADVELAFEIINARYNARATTLLSTEFSVDELISMDEALGSRIVEMTDGGKSFLSITGEGKNWRLRPRTVETGKAAPS